MNIEKIVIGTAQFQDFYGISNKSITSKTEKKKIINLAKNHGISFLDTAFSYQNVEEFLGFENISNFNVISKIPKLLNNFQTQNNFEIKKFLEISLKRLKIDKLYALLLHDASQLNDLTYSQLLELKNKNLIKKIGVSCYSPKNINNMINKYDLDIIQLPYNIIDRRFENHGLLKKLNSKSIEIHARSVFLQGLLLMDQKEIPNYFNKWIKIFNHWDNLTNNNIKKKIAYCLNFALSNDFIDKILIGFNDSKQLINILNFKKNLFDQNFIQTNLSQLSNDDENLVHPFNWIS